MGNRILSSIKFILLFLFIFSCNPSNRTKDPVQTLAAIIKADNAGDIEKIVSLYTPDAMLIPAGKANISGNDSIRQNYMIFFLLPNLKWMQIWTR